MSLKRKAVHGSIPHADTPDTKRRRAPDQYIANAQETPQRTTQVGLEFLEKLKGAKDKQDHLIASHFLMLPDPNELPEYYQVIQLPIALETIQAKLQQYEYANISGIEADLKRMISNAKQFNEKNSEVHTDAEKIRKLVSNQFKELNPAYADPSYTAIPTPLPGEAPHLQQVFQRPHAPATPTPLAPMQSLDRPKRTLNLRMPKDPAGRDSSTPGATGAATGGFFAGKTFQEAQEMIIDELIGLKNSEGEVISGNFLQLPSRALKDYYQTIKTPESLYGLRKKAVGKQGHAEPTGVSLMKSWGEFEHQCSLIWRNARHYNEDGSEISNLATELEAHFSKRLAEARATIPDPSGPPKIKLKLSAKSPEPQGGTPNPRVTLNVGPRPSPGTITVDADALKRQQEMIKSVSHIAAPPGGVVPGDPMGTQSGLSQSPPAGANGVKNELSAVTNPGALQDLNRPIANGHMAAGMLPPSMAARHHNGSPYPPQTAHYAPHQSGVFEQRVRAEGKTAADALITTLDVRTHPSIQNIPEDEKIAFTFSPMDKLTQQSFTFSVSQAHNFIRVQPTLQPQASTRASKLGVNIQGHKVKTVDQQWNRQLEEVDPQRPIYDIPLQEGQINRIEVWILGGPARGAPKVGTGQDIEFERYTLFIQRQRA